MKCHILHADHFSSDASDLLQTNITQKDKKSHSADWVFFTALMIPSWCPLHGKLTHWITTTQRQYNAFPPDERNQSRVQNTCGCSPDNFWEEFRKSL